MARIKGNKMEVHHHPHVEKKNFKEYLLEGLMIFVAVTLGFFAEGLREHLGNNEKERKNIESIVKSVSLDTLHLQEVIAQNIKQVKGIDSFVALRGQPVVNTDTKWRYYYYTLNYLWYDIYFFPDNGGVEQLKSSGVLSLISDHSVTDSILHYDNFNKVINLQEADCHYIFEELLSIETKVLDVSVIKNPAVGWVRNSTYSLDSVAKKLPSISNDTALQQQLFSYATIFSLSNNVYIADLKNQLVRGRNLIAFLKEKYGLDDI